MTLMEGFCSKPFNRPLQSALRPWKQTRLSSTPHLAACQKRSLNGMHFVNESTTMNLLLIAFWLSCAKCLLPFTSQFSQITNFSAYGSIKRSIGNSFLGFTSGHTSSIYRRRGFFLSCSRLACHARMRRKPGISILSISSICQPLSSRLLYVEYIKSGSVRRSVSAAAPLPSPPAPPS